MNLNRVFMQVSKKIGKIKLDQITVFTNRFKFYHMTKFDKGDNAANNIATGSRVASTPSISFPMEASFGLLRTKIHSKSKTL